MTGRHRQLNLQQTPALLLVAVEGRTFVDESPWV